MYKKALLLIVVALQATCLLAQQKKRGYQWEWQIGTSVGVNLPVTKLLKGRPTDNLVEYSDNSTHFQFYTLGVFFHPRWGIDFGLSGTNPPKANRRELFNEAIQREYNDLYYIDPETDKGGRNFTNAVTLRAMIGITYRWEKKQWLFYPKLSLGSTTFNTNHMVSYLKEKGGNHYQELSFLNSRSINREAFTMGLSAVAGYRICRWLTVNAELRSTYFKSNFSFEKTIRDLETSKVVSSETISYREPVFTLTPQVGVVLSFKPNPNPSSKSKKHKKDMRGDAIPRL